MTAVHTLPRRTTLVLTAVPHLSTLPVHAASGLQAPGWAVLGHQVLGGQVLGSTA